jgi:hypothetical protein
LTWRELANDFTGTWTVDGNQFLPDATVYAFQLTN